MKSIIRERLVCPECLSKLKINEKQIICCKCKSTFSRVAGIPDLLTKKDKKELKKEMKFSRRYVGSGVIYRLLKKITKNIIGLKTPRVPNLILNRNGILPAKYLKDKSILLNIGGLKKSNKNKINLDIIKNEHTDLIANVEKIPLKDNSVDFVSALAVLHHVENPHTAINEIKRVLKKGGYIYTTDCFFYPYHPVPRDIHRWTREGYKSLFKDFKEIELKNIHGPTTTLLKVLQIYLPILFSFNLDTIYAIEYVIFSYLLYPFKFLDLLLKDHKKADYIAGGFVFLGKKK